jgi:hypothetical protein
VFAIASRTELEQKVQIVENQTKLQRYDSHIDVENL